MMLRGDRVRSRKTYIGNTLRVVAPERSGGGGSVWESNPPELPKAPPIGFEDRASHQAQSAPEAAPRSGNQPANAIASISTLAYLGSAAA